MRSIITLTTDFGFDDPYVGIMKGVLLTVDSNLKIVDLSHGITPHSVLEADFVIRSSYSFFPGATLHVVVVDPGVGGARRIIYVEKNGHRFLAPDNGVLSGPLDQADRVFCVENRDLFLDAVSHTFHGRDIFAPVAGRLCAGLDPADLGPPVNDPVRLEWPEPTLSGDTVDGCVLYIDVFGNIVTNIRAEQIKQLGEGVHVFLKGEEIGEPQQSYDALDKETPLALINSFGLLEVAVREGNASQMFGVGTGDEVIVTRTVNSR